MKARPQPKKNVVVMNQRPSAAPVLVNKTKIAAAPVSKIVTAPARCSLIIPKQQPNHNSQQSSRRYSGQQTNWRKMGRGAALVGIIIVVVAASYGLFCSPYFRANSVTIDGVKLLDGNILRQQAETALNGHFWQIWQGNFWLASSAKFCGTLKDHNLADCYLKRHWPNQLTLKIQEEPVVAIWQENGWYYWIDRFGRVAKQELPSPASAKLYPVVNCRDSLVNERQVAISPDFWQLIIDSQTNWLGTAPRAFNFNNQEPNSIEAIAANQQIVKLTLRTSLAEQLKLWQTGQSKFAQQLSQAKVIDLRYGDRIIYQ